jgi:predicted phage terminase large subunit-like protein
MWAAAHGHIRFVAAFASAAAQAEGHLATFKRELEDNVNLRADFPDLVAPKTRGRGTLEADRVSLYHARSGFVFAAAGMDTTSLGMKVGETRPDLLLLDDIEPHEGMYTAALAKKRLDTLQSAILPLNVYAHVIIVGTVTMQGSIVHQIVQATRGEVDEDNAWVAEEHIVGRHTLPIVLDDDGQRRSIWPEKWPLDYLESIEHTRTYAKNYANDPLGAEGDYWTLDDIRRTPREAIAKWGITRILVSVDPAVTTKATSDYTGLAVIGWSPSLNRCVVLEVRQVRKSGADLRLDVLKTIERWNAGLVLVETNQGGELWRDILWGLPVKVKTVHQVESKEVRAADVLDHYQRGKVYHLEDAGLRDFEGQLVAFPRAPHDDMVDAGGSGIRYFLSRNRGRNRGSAGTGVGAVSVGYAG